MIAVSTEGGRGLAEINPKENIVFYKYKFGNREQTISNRIVVYLFFKNR